MEILVHQERQPKVHLLPKRKMKMKMKRKESSLFVGLFITMALMISGGCSAQPEQTSPAASIHTIVVRVPSESAVKALVGDKTLGSISPDADDGETVISDRILDGFQAAPTGLAVEHGRSMAWGFKFQQGNEQSVVIYDASGHLMLAAIVTDIARLDDGNDAALTSLAAYRKRVVAAGVKPQVMVFAHSRDDLNAAYPLFKRWLQANLLGFNVDCSKTPNACDLAVRVTVPTQAFIISRSGKGLTKTTPPAASAASIPLAKFVQ